MSRAKEFVVSVPTFTEGHLLQVDAHFCLVSSPVYFYFPFHVALSLGVWLNDLTTILLKTLPKLHMDSQLAKCSYDL